MSLDSVREEFKKYGIEDRIIILNESSATVHLASVALGCTEAEIAKTMSFLVDEQPIVIVMAGDVKISNHKYKSFFHKKARMLHGEEVVEYTSHPIGGVCPFGLKDNVIIYLDESLKRFTNVYPACGSPNSAIKLTVSELEKYTNYKEWIDVTEQIDV